MKGWVFFLLIVLALFVIPCPAQGIGQSERECLVQGLDLDALERAGEEYLGPVEISQNLDVSELLRSLWQRGLDSLEGILKASVRSCVLLLAITLLCGLADGMGGTGKGEGLRVTTLAAVLSITAVSVGDVHSLMERGEEAIGNMRAFGDVLLPAVALAAAASGAPAAAAVKHSVTLFFSDFLLHFIHDVLIPLCYAFVATHAAWAALGNEGLRRVGGMLKWLSVTFLSLILLAFVGYLNVSGVISGSVDVATLKAARFTISNMVPLVGGVISDTAETLLAGASILRNAAGVFGMLGVLGICLLPFLSLGVHYLAYKCTAVLASTVSHDSRVTGLIDAIGSAFGLILAMTASCAMLLIVAMISAVSAVGG